jgi:hypothetical protein
MPTGANAGQHARRLGVAAAREISEIPAGFSSMQESLLRPADVGEIFIRYHHAAPPGDTGSCGFFAQES